MIVARAESAQHYPALVGFAVAVGVLQKQQLDALAAERAATAQFDSRGNHQTIREDSRFVAAPVATCVFEDENFAIGNLAGFNLRIARLADAPQPSARVETHLNRFDYTVMFRGEKIDFKSVGDLERSQFDGGIVRVGGERGRSKHQTPNTKETPNPKSKHAV